MSKILPDLHDGHAPIALHHAFHDALERLESWVEGEPEPLVSIDGGLFPATAVLARMTGCTDLVPLRTRDVLRAVTQATPGAQSGDTFGRWATLVLSIYGGRQGPTLFSEAGACACGAL